jgi:Fur family transcriptional regulator, ferric uptake regulator
MRIGSHYHIMPNPSKSKAPVGVAERTTRQRDAIKVAIQDSTRPLLPQEVLARARALAPGVGLATVYRTLKLLVADGAIQSITLPGDTPRYESAKSDHHHHFQCEHCERVYDIPGCPGNLRALAPRGFRVERHEVTLYGRCSDCGKRSAHAPQ